MSNDLIKKTYKKAAIWIYDGEFFDIGNIKSLRRANNFKIKSYYKEFFKTTKSTKWHIEYKEKYVKPIKSFL